MVQLSKGGGEAASAPSQLTCLSFPQRLLQTVRSHVIGVLDTAVVFAGRWHVGTVGKLLWRKKKKKNTDNYTALAGGPSFSCRFSSYSTARSPPVALLSPSFSGPHPLCLRRWSLLSLLSSPTAADEPQVLGILWKLRRRCAFVGGAAKVTGDDWQPRWPISELSNLSRRRPQWLLLQCRLIFFSPRQSCKLQERIPHKQTLL